MYGRDGNVARVPINVTPLFGLFQDIGYQPGIFGNCARQCLAQITNRPVVVVVPSYGLAVVGASLMLEGQTAGAVVAGYAFIDCCTASTVELLARQAGAPVDHLRSVARITPSMPQRRLVVNGELLQVLGNAILRENLRTRQYEEKSAELVAAAATKDEFLAVIAHELRAPLAPIMLRLQRLQGERDPARIDESAAVIERNVRLQVRLVEDLLDLSRAARGAIKLALQPLDLGVEAGSAVTFARETARERNIVLQLMTPDQPLPILADRDRLQQIFQNLLGNALKFTPAGGTVTVTVHHRNRSGIVSIADTGQGITLEFLPFVFEMFRREDPGHGHGRHGLGIGLALVRRLVELHGGDIRVTSAGISRGTEVVVRVPLVRDVPDVLPSLLRLIPSDAGLVGPPPASKLPPRDFPSCANGR
jgi:signal transduction histidine kinase